MAKTFKSVTISMMDGTSNILIGNEGLAAYQSFMNGRPIAVFDANEDATVYVAPWAIRAAIPKYEEVEDESATDNFCQTEEQGGGEQEAI